MKNIEDLVELSKVEPAVNPANMRTIESGEDLVLVRESKRIKIDPVWNTNDKYEGPLYKHFIAKNPGYSGIYIRRSVANMLDDASHRLPKNWALVLRAGHRPVEVQKGLFGLVKDELSKKNPDLSETELTNLTRDYVSDPDQKVPPHCAGSAVDVEVIDTESGKLVDFGSLMNEESDVSHIHSTKVNQQAQKNRLTLLRAMLESGFAPLRTEWWHFSYGDQNWAAFYNEPNAIYGNIEPSI